MDEQIERIASSRNPRIREEQIVELVPYIASKQTGINENEVRALIKLVTALFRAVCARDELDGRKVKALTTKFRDAGRRSAPWRPTSSRVPGRPQDGSDGNRISRWLLPQDHKFYAAEVTATLVEVKYVLQTLSMANAPDISAYNIRNAFTPWLLEHDLVPGEYLDPVQLIPINFMDFLEDPRSVQSGHIYPLDRGGVHHPDNTFLMLFRSNQIQGNLTVVELINLMGEIVQRHEHARAEGLPLEALIRQKTS